MECTRRAARLFVFLALIAYRKTDGYSCQFLQSATNLCVGSSVCLPGYVSLRLGQCGPRRGARRMAHLVMDGSEISGCRDQNGENDMFTGGDELAMRMMISRNRAERQAEERQYMPLDVAVRWARMTQAWFDEESWDDWKKRWPDHPYVPADPEKYYSTRGVWLGWRFWLGNDEGHSSL